MSAYPLADRLYIEAHGDAALLHDRVGHLGRVSHTGTGTAKDPSAHWFEVRPSRRTTVEQARERLAALGVDPCVDLVIEVQPSQGHVMARQPSLFTPEDWRRLRAASDRLKALVPDADAYRWRLVAAPVDQLAESIRTSRLNARKTAIIVERLKANTVPLPVTAVAAGVALMVVDGHHRVAAFRDLKRATIPTLVGTRADITSSSSVAAG